MSETNLNIGIHADGAKEVKNDIDEIKNSLSGMNKEAESSPAKLPLTEAMQEMLDKAKKAKEAIANIADTEGLEGFRKHLMEVSTLLDTIKKNTKLGEALAVGKDFDMSGFKEIESFASKISPIISTLNAEEKAREDILKRLSAQAEQAAQAEANAAAKAAEAQANMAARSEKEQQRLMKETMQVALEKYDRQAQAAQAAHEAEVKAAQAQAAYEAQANSMYANMGRSAAADYQRTGDLQGYMTSLQSIIALRDQAMSMRALPAAIATGDIDAQLSLVKSLSIANAQLSGDQKNVESATKGATSALNQNAQSISRASQAAASSKGHFANLWSSLMRIAKLRFLRGIIRSVTQGFREGLTNIYQYSQALNGLDASNVSGSLDGLATSLLTMKNTIATAVAPVIASVIPIIQQIVAWFNAAMNALAQFFAALRGQTTYTRAKTVQATWEGVKNSTNGATKAAKEYQRTILGFDELNVLNDENQGGNGGGGGGGSSSASPTEMFEEAELQTTGLQGAINKLGKFLQPVFEAISQLPTFADGAIQGLIGIIEGDTPAVMAAMDKFQKAFKGSTLFRTLFTEGNAFFAGIAEKISSFTGNVRITILTAVLGIVQKLKPILKPIYKMFGIDIDNVEKKLIDSIDKTKKAMDKSINKTKAVEKAYREWAKGNYSTGRLQAEIKAVNGVFGDSEEQIKAAQDAIEELESHGFDSGELLKGMSNAQTATERAETGIKNLKKKIKEFEAQGLDTTKLKESLKVLETKSDKVVGSFKGIETTTDRLNKLNPSFNTLQNSMENNIGKKADNVKGRIDAIGGALKKLELIKPSVKIKTTLTIQQAANETNKKILSYTEAGGGFVPRFDNGGFPGLNSGQLFIANENARPELVGRIGNRTAVANTGQMVDALAAGVAEGFMSVQGGNENVEFNVYLDRTRLAQAVQQGQRNLNRRYAVAVR